MSPENPEEVRQRIDSLYARAERATGNYNATRAMSAAGRSRGVPLSRRPDADLDAVARQWFDAARATAGPTVPAVLPVDRMPSRPETPYAPPVRADELPAHASELPELPSGGAGRLELPPAPARTADSTPLTGTGPGQGTGPGAGMLALPGGRPAEPAPLPTAPLPTAQLPAPPLHATRFPPAPGPEAQPAPLPLPAAPAPAAQLPRTTAVPSTPFPGGPVRQAAAPPTPSANAPSALIPSLRGPRLPAAAPGRAAPRARKSSSQRKLATASDLLSRYTARLTTQAALVHQPVPTAPVFTDPLTDTGSFTAVQAVSPFAGGDTGSFSLPGPDASYAPYANTQLPSDTGTFTLPTEPYSLETGAFAAPVFDSLAETGSFPAIFPDPQAAAQQPEPRPTATEYAPRPAPGTPGPQPAAPAPAPLDASVSPDPRAVRVAQAIAFARAQLGKPCVWGATGPDSYDCSSLTQAAWRAAGVTLPRAAHQLATAGTPVTLAMLEPGDLVLFFDDDRHVGLCTGDGLMIHAPGPGSTIQEESIYGAGEAAIHRVIRPV